MKDEHVRFHYNSIEELKQELESLGLELPFSDDVSVLAESAAGCPNRLVFQPMEGCDGICKRPSFSEGAPDELTLRRYKKYAEGGAGMIWFEATAVLPEGRANPRQLWLRYENLSEFRNAVELMKETCMKVNGYEPKIILQATHSGRYAKPNGFPEPIIAYNNPIFEKDNRIDPSRIITDAGLRRIEEAYYNTALLALSAGFDGIDVKCCHRYLNSELLSAYDREGDYGGSYENRTRFYMNAIKAVREAIGSAEMTIGSRLNIYDGFPYPYGFGVAHEPGAIEPDMTEPLRLVGDLIKSGVTLLDITMGNPYFNPHVNRPYDHGGYIPEEHPLVGVARMLNNTAVIQKAYPELPVVCSGLSYLRQYAPLVAAGMIKSGGAALAGFGREGFAYPDFPRDIIKTGAMDSKKVCVCCSKCTELMRAGSITGCVVRDRYYTELYKTVVAKKH